MKKVTWWVVVLSLFTIPFLSLYVDNSLFFPFITGKNFAFRILVEIAFAGWCILALLDKRYRPEFSWTFVWFKLLVVWMIVANMLAVNPHKAFWSNFERMDGFVTLIHVYLFFVVVASVFSVDGLWKKWWYAFIAGSALVALHGVGQLLGSFKINQSSTRLDGGIGNSEYLAGYMLFAIGITLWQACEKRGKEWVWLSWCLYALAALQLVILYGTQTRGAVVAIIGAAFFGAALWMIEAGKQGKQRAAVLLLGLCILVGGFISIRETSFVQDNEALRRIASISIKELGTRLIIWDMAITGIQERPLTGWGHEGFNYIFAKHYQPSMYAQEPWFDRAHNVYLDWLVAGGVPALIFFLLLLCSAAWSFYRSDASRAHRILLLSILVAYGIQGLVVFDNLFTYIPLAAILAMAHVHSKRPIACTCNMKDIEDVVVYRLAVPVILIVLIGIIWSVNIKNIQAGRYLITAMTPVQDSKTRLEFFKKAIEKNPFGVQEIREQMIQFAANTVSSNTTPIESKEEIAAYTVQQVDIQIAALPLDPRMYLQSAILYRTLGRFDEALARSTRARELSPNKQSIIFEQGINAWQAGKKKEALNFFIEGYELEPAYADAATYVAAGYVIQGDIPRAKEFLIERFGTTTTTGDNSVLVIAYYQEKAWKELLEILLAKYRENNNPQTGFQLVGAYAESGRIIEARAQVKEIISKHPEAATQGAAILKQLGGI